jgi:hypothetical protein
MDSSVIYQRVIDALGKILVDKDPIKANTPMTDLILDKQDFEKFFSDLQSDFGIVIPPRLKAELSQLPDRDPHNKLTLKDFADVIASQMTDRS